MTLNNAHEGYDYQDLLTCYFILREILEGNLDSVFTVDKKHTSADIPDRFDDLVIKNGNKVQRKQIKYSNDDVSKTFKKDDLANDSGYELAIFSLFETWQDLRTPESEFRLCLAWNEPTEENIIRVLSEQANQSSFENFATKVFNINLNNLWETNPEKFNRWDSFSRYVQENNTDRDLFKQFCNELLIEVNLPKASLDFTKPSDLELILIQQAETLGIGTYPNEDVYVSDFLIRFAKLAGTYRTKSLKISARNILKELRVKTDFGGIEQKFLIDRSKNITDDQKYTSFLAQIFSNQNNLLIAEPGAGKSWFLTNFIEYLEKNNHPVIRHYCFTSTQDAFYEHRITDNVFFGNLVTELTNTFPDITQYKQTKLASNIHELNLLLSHITDPLVIIIDGLDHIKRVLTHSKSLSKDKTRIIEYISQIKLPENISMVLGSQDVEEVQTLMDDYGFDRIELPKWKVDDVIELMNKFNISDIVLNQQTLSEAILFKSEGNLLYLTYILKTLTNTSEIDIDLLNSLPAYDFNLESYYKYLSSQLEGNNTAEILSCLDFAVTKSDLKSINPFSHRLEDDIKILSPVISEYTLRGGIKLYHDSFRRYNLENSSSDLQKNIFSLIAKWLESLGFYDDAKSYRYLLGYLIKAEQYSEVCPYAKMNFLTESLYHGYSELFIKKNIKNFSYTAKELQDWSLFIYISELNRTFATTVSKDYHSQFLENFEFFFETICLIYGNEKGNSLLFFNAETNFSDEITAKAFTILHKNGYSPRWDEIASLFKEDIKLEHMPYYVYGVLEDTQKLDKLLINTLKHDDKDYFDSIVTTLVKEDKGDVVVSFFENYENKNSDVANRINKIFDFNNCSYKVIIDDGSLDETQELIPHLEPLNLDFISSSIDSNELNRFYRKVTHSAKYCIDSLTSFEQTIPSHNFFYNWLKFFIRLEIIEKTLEGEEKEQEVVKNIAFLATDVSRSKGVPRAMDFTRQNADLLNITLKKALDHINSSESWQAVISDLITIPFNAMEVIEDRFVNEHTIPHIITAYDSFEKDEEQEYIKHADYAFKKALYYAKSHTIEKSKKELKCALRYITNYHHHKDITLSEIIEPLEALNSIHANLAKDYSKKLKYLCDAVEKHTGDGKETKWLTIEWFKKLLIVDYALAGRYLLNELINNPYFWKLEYMFIDFLNASTDVNPVILNFLYKLSPTNNRDEYLTGFLNILEQIKNTHHAMVRNSIIILSERDWNDRHNTLNDITMRDFNQLACEFSLSSRIIKKEENHTGFSATSETLQETITKQLRLEDIKNKTEKSFIQHCSDKELFTTRDLNTIYFYIKEVNKDSFTEKLLLPIIEKRFPKGGKLHYEKLHELITHYHDVGDETKINLLVNNFVYSTNGWSERFVQKESLKTAIEIDREITLKILAEEVCNLFPTTDYMAKSSANLIIAFEYAGIDSDVILAMYKQAFDVIKNRLPDENDFDWKSVEDVDLLNMNSDEFAIALILSKSKHADTTIQREVICAMNYFLEHNETLLIKPLKWFFHNPYQFNQITLAGILELLLIESEDCKQLIIQLEDDLKQLLQMDNLYIHNIVQDILSEVNV